MIPRFRITTTIVLALNLSVGTSETCSFPRFSGLVKSFCATLVLAYLTILEQLTAAACVVTLPSAILHLG